MHTIGLHFIHRDYDGSDDVKFMTLSEFVPREGDLITINDPLDGPDGSVSTGLSVSKVEYVYNLNQTYYGNNKLDYVKIYI